jgi:hypothetical protein
VLSADVAEGTVQLTNVHSSDQADFPTAITLHFAENMRCGLPMPQIQAGDQIEAAVIELGAAGSGDYWADSLHALFEGGPGDPAGGVVAQREQDGSMMIGWQLNAQFTGYRVIRYSAESDPHGPGDPFHYGAPNMTQDYSIDVGSDVMTYRDSGVLAGRSYTWDVYGLDGSGAEFLGTADDHFFGHDDGHDGPPH